MKLTPGAPGPSPSSGDLVSRVISYLSPAILLYIVIESASVICISKAKDAHSKPIYNSATVVLFAEITKLLISLAGLHGEDPYLVNFRATFSWTRFLSYGVPAVLYAVNNNIFLFVLTLIAPSVFQLLLNLRVAWTGLTFRLVLGRPVTLRQVVAMGVLMVGCIVVQLEQFRLAVARAPAAAAVAATPEVFVAPAPAAYSLSDPVALLQSHTGRFILGVALTLFYTVVSTTASVVNEVMVKSSGSLHAANLQLYSFGILFNLTGALFQQQATGGSSFRGWSNPIVWAVFLSMSFSGLLVSRVMKSYDNIVKIFCVSLSNFVVYMFSVAADGEPLSVVFVGAFAFISLAALEYQKEKGRLDTELQGLLAKKEASTAAELERMVVSNGRVVIAAADDDFTDVEQSSGEGAGIQMVDLRGGVAAGAGSGGNGIGSASSSVSGPSVS